jgi:hypothetical protein
MAKNNPPIPQEQIEESHRWRDWFTQISNLILPSMYEVLAVDVLDTGTGVMPTSTTAWKNVNKYAVDILIKGGTVSIIELGRYNQTTKTVDYITTGLTSGFITLSPQDYIKVTYSSAPTQYIQIPR